MLIQSHIDRSKFKLSNRSFSSHHLIELTKSRSICFDANVSDNLTQQESVIAWSLGNKTNDVLRG